jgi:hypothetical protein
VVDLGYEAGAVPKLDIAPINQMFGAHRSVSVIVAYEGSLVHEVPVFGNQIGPVIRHSVALFGPAQLTRNPPRHGAGFNWVSYHQPCLCVMALQTLKGAPFEPLRVG